MSLDEKNTIAQLLDECVVLHSNAVIIEKAIFYRNHFSLKVPDALVVSAAGSNELPFLTADKDFAAINDTEILYYQP